MIKPSFIKKQVEKATRVAATPPVLRSLVFSVVDQMAQEHYGSQYPLKCLQTAAATQQLLATMGIRSTLWCGAVCFAEVFDEASDVSWGGFWGEDHHVWVITEFKEYVDLSISRLHQHPNSRRTDGVPVPAVWWDDITQWPSVIRYLPDSPVGIGLEGSDAADLAQFLNRVEQAFNRSLAHGQIDAVKFSPLLTGPNSMNDLYAQGLPWAVRSYVIQEHNIPFPSWIVERQEELWSAWEAGTTAPRRMSQSIR